MFGAETILMNRCENKDLFNQTVHLINDFKEYFLRTANLLAKTLHPETRPRYSTLEEKVGLHTEMRKELRFGSSALWRTLESERPQPIVCTGGNDLVASTALASAGCHMALFTTGRGTFPSNVCSTMKISTNSGLAERKPGWIDFQCRELLLKNEPMENMRTIY